MKIQWHTGFASAIELELAENKADLIYEREHNLNKKPLEIDLLVIKKEDKAQVKNKIIRQVKPVRLFQYFTDHNIQLTNPYNGIYYVMDNVLFPTQIIVTKELNPKEHLWLSALSGGMQKGIKGTVTALRDCGQNEEAIKEAIVRVYNLSSEEAERYL